MRLKQAQGPALTVTELQDRFEGLLQEHRGIVLKLASLYSRNAEDRRDLTQEISVQLWRAFRSYDAGRSFSTWMYRVALNVAISFERAARTRGRHLGSLDSPQVGEMADKAAEPKEANDRAQQLLQILEALEPLDRALMALYLDDQTYQQIADILGLTETNVATKISRLKQAIRKQSALEAGDENHGN